MLLLTVSINYCESDYLLLFSLLEFALWLAVTALLISVPKRSSHDRQTRTRFNRSGVSTRSAVLVLVRTLYCLYITY
jgi:hypothetical protein